MIVKVVLQDANQGEVTLGPFRQGVVIETTLVAGSSVPAIIDVITKGVITRCFGEFWSHGEAWYSRAFVQAVAVGEEI